VPPASPERRAQSLVRQLAGLETDTLYKGIVGCQCERLAGGPAGHLPVNQQRLALAVGYQPQHHKGLFAGGEIMALDDWRAMAAKQRDDAVDQPVNNGVLRPQIMQLWPRVVLCPGLAGLLDRLFYTRRISA
jgi:hypothetical protein